jgi:UDP-glucose 4-epimerase
VKPIVVTGARGYIGSALARRLAERGWPLRLVSRSLARSAVVPPSGANVEVIEADLGEEAVWSRLMQDAASIVHLSSRTDLRAAEADPAGDKTINVEPVRAMVRAAARADAPVKVVFASTVTIVGARHANPVDERTPDDPCSIYDRHKLACETILQQATASGELRACILRLSNVYGIGGASVNSNRGILNMMIQRALKGEPLTLYGEGASIRDFIHIDDVVEAFALAAEDVADVCDGSRYVIASSCGYSLAEAYRLVADAAFAATGRRVEIRHVAEPADLHPIERRNFVGNSALFQQRTGWRPRICLAEGIRRNLGDAATRAEIAQ